MDNIYIYMLIALVLLAAIDLVVGVSNDAINFLNSAIGSKVISVRNIMIIASLGIFLGAATSSGMMEVARKGIFMPGEFYFNEIMYIFMAVMIADILLLDTFNSLGMPTSTTVSIVFELLGAAVAMAIIKISVSDTETIANLSKYINTAKALQIIFGILLSVVVAFSIGAMVQFVSRLVYSFQFEKKKKYVNAIFGGLAITSITYFIFMKGLKGTEYYKALQGYLEGNELYVMLGGFLFWTVLAYILSLVSKFNVLKFIIGIGTFSLALAFSGNDLVNFIGVPIAALNSYEAWMDPLINVDGLAANEFSMGILSKKVPTQTMLLLIAGGIMVLTLWFSNKAKKVAATEINLSRQNDTAERFQPNQLSRFVVRGTSALSRGFDMILPSRLNNYIEKQFTKPAVIRHLENREDQPAFDMIRASVNLVVAGILISIATSYKLPLSTTYVTFMVAMGTSLADKAWGRESAVYRVAGVLNVIGGWFLTAFSAFMIAAIFVTIMYFVGSASIFILFALVLFVLGRSTLKHAKEAKQTKANLVTEKAELKTINSVMKDSSEHISEVTRRVEKLYGHVVTDLSAHNLNKLSKTKKHVKKLNEELDELRNNVFYFIKSLDDSSVKASRFYIHVLDYLQDVMQSIGYISSTSFVHVDNNHKNLKKSQIADLNKIKEELSSFLHDIQKTFENQDFSEAHILNDKKEKLFDSIALSLDNQVDRIRTEDSSKKNTTLYFGILLETKDLVRSLLSLLTLFDKYKTLYKKDNTNIFG
ncbi:MAG TPA: inorganic phosphate transporter [Lutibacter sp.]|nr:inorganic phosphate transporter [Lutibacter sp.]